MILLAYEPPPASWTGSSTSCASTRRVPSGSPQPRPERVVFASSADVYGPWHEDAVTENTTAGARDAVRGGQARGGAAPSVVDCVSLRIATVFGPGENGPRAIPSFVRALHADEQPVVDGDGSDVRDYVHVVDVAVAFLNAAATTAHGDGPERRVRGSGDRRARSCGGSAPPWARRCRLTTGRGSVLHRGSSFAPTAPARPSDSRPGRTSTPHWRKRSTGSEPRWSSYARARVLVPAAPGEQFARRELSVRPGRAFPTHRRRGRAFGRPRAPRGFVPAPR